MYKGSPSHVSRRSDIAERIDKAENSPLKKILQQRINSTRTSLKTKDNSKERLQKYKERSMDTKLRREQDSVDALKDKVQEHKHQKSVFIENLQEISSDPITISELQNNRKVTVDPKESNQSSYKSSHPRVSPYFAKMGLFSQKSPKKSKPLLLLTKGYSTKVPDSLVMTSRRKMN